MVFYAGLFVCIDIAYNVFEHEILARANAMQVSEETRRFARRRSLGVLGELHDRYAGRLRRAARRVRSDMRRPDSSFAAQTPPLAVD